MKLCMYLFIYSLILMSLALICEGCGRGAIKIQNNGYKDVVVAVGDKVAEDSHLLDRIKQVFTEASALLYSATRNRAYFEEITILVPSTWNNMSYGTAGKESFDKSDIVVDVPSSRGDRPFTIKTTPCGEPGHYMILTPGFFTDDSIANLYGSHGKVLVHEWAHLRYGVFDEYPTGSVSQFYADEEGTIEGVRCSKGITDDVPAGSLKGRGNQYILIGQDYAQKLPGIGTMVNRVTGEACSYSGNFPESDCVFVDKESERPESGYASLMYKSFVDTVSLFCDNDSDGSSKTRHNSKAPTDQNRMCDGRSVWDVLYEHKDFINGTNPPREVNNTTPTFRVVQPKTFRTVLVLDKSGSMNTSDRLAKLRQGCYNYITNIIHDDEYLGIVWFDSSTVIAQNLTQINNDTRVELLNSLPTEAYGGTSIGGGIERALDMLTAGNIITGGSVIVVTDGMENQSPFLIDVTAQVQEAEITLHSIAITESADSKLDLLATSTGGLSFLYSGSSTSNAINEAFLKIGNLNSDPTERSYVIRSQSFTLSSSVALSDTILIDSSLGRSLQFSFDYGGTSIEPSVTSPSGLVYETSDMDVVTHDTTFKIYHFTIPMAEIGEWRYNVTSVVSSQILAVTVKAQSAQAGSYPIVSSVHWGKTSIASIEPNVQNPTQELYASISQGFSPILNADVVATVERPDLSTVDLKLLDNGAGADAFAGDGIYSAYFTQFNGKGRHGIKVTVGSTEATVLSPSRIIGRPVASRNFADTTDDENTIPVKNVSRNEAGESFQLDNFQGSEGDKYFNPGKINDLLVVSASYGQQMVSLQWTAVGDQLDMGQASSYDLRLGTDFQQMSINFTGQTQVTQDMIVSGGNISEPKLAGEMEGMNISVPTRGSVTYVFAIKALDTDGRDVAGPLSNIASASLENLEQENFIPDDPPEDGLSTAAIVILSIGITLVVITLFTAIAVSIIKGATGGAANASLTQLNGKDQTKLYGSKFIRPQMHGPYYDARIYRAHQPEYNYISNISRLNWQKPNDAKLYRGFQPQYDYI